jgi:hypothetical protein
VSRLGSNVAWDAAGQRTKTLFATPPRRAKTDVLVFIGRISYGSAVNFKHPSSVLGVIPRSFSAMSELPRIFWTPGEDGILGDS